MQEEWKRLNYRGKDLGDFYLVSNFGEIKGVKIGKIRSKNINHEGYYFVSISLGSRSIKQCIKLHIAVADTFIGYNKEDGLVVNHMDGNKLNNNLENLEYCTYKENALHAIRNNLLVNMGINKRAVINKTTNKIYNSATSASLDICKCKEDSERIRKNIVRALRKNTTAYGQEWKYII